MNMRHGKKRGSWTMKTIKIVSVLILFILLLVVLTGCINSNEENQDGGLENKKIIATREFIGYRSPPRVRTIEITLDSRDRIESMVIRTEFFSDGVAESFYGDRVGLTEEMSVTISERTVTQTFTSEAAVMEMMLRGTETRAEIIKILEELRIYSEIKCI